MEKLSLDYKLQKSPRFSLELRYNSIVKLRKSLNQRLRSSMIASDSVAIKEIEEDLNCVNELLEDIKMFCIDYGKIFDKGSELKGENREKAFSILVSKWELLSKEINKVL